MASAQSYEHFQWKCIGLRISWLLQSISVNVTASCWGIILSWLFLTIKSCSNCVLVKVQVFTLTKKDHISTVLIFKLTMRDKDPFYSEMMLLRVVPEWRSDVYPSGNGIGISYRLSLSQDPNVNLAKQTFIRGLPFQMSAKFSDFFSPSPLCPHFHATSLTELPYPARFSRTPPWVRTS